MTERLARVSDLLVERGLRLATAESCTGGLVAARFTERPGASRFLEAGIVAYSYPAKERLLGVRPDTLARHGAVSEAVAREMVAGARAHAEAAVAITGVAGPGGGTPDKPVGTVWVAASVTGSTRVRRHHFDGDRTAVREASADAALALLETLLVEEG